MELPEKLGFRVVDTEIEEYELVTAEEGETCRYVAACLSKDDVAEIVRRYNGYAALKQSNEDLVKACEKLIKEGWNASIHEEIRELIGSRL